MFRKTGPLLFLALFPLVVLAQTSAARLSVVAIVPATCQPASPDSAPLAHLACSRGTTTTVHAQAVGVATASLPARMTAASAPGEEGALPGVLTAPARVTITYQP